MRMWVENNEVDMRNVADLKLHFDYQKPARLEFSYSDAIPIGSKVVFTDEDYDDNPLFSGEVKEAGPLVVCEGV